MRTIRFYRTSTGHSPVEDFIDSLRDRDAQKVTWVLRIIERMNIVPEQYFKKLIGTEDIWEIRVRSGGNSYRLLGFFDGPLFFTVTSGFSKKSQKTPIQEIELAERRRLEYYQRRTKI